MTGMFPPHWLQSEAELSGALSPPLGFSFALQEHGTADPLTLKR